MPPPMLKIRVTSLQYWLEMKSKFKSFEHKPCWMTRWYLSPLHWTELQKNNGVKSIFSTSGKGIWGGCFLTWCNSKQDSWNKSCFGCNPRSWLFPLHPLWSCLSTAPAQLKGDVSSSHTTGCTRRKGLETNCLASPQSAPQSQNGSHPY